MTIGCDETPPDMTLFALNQVATELTARARGNAWPESIVISLGLWALLETVCRPDGDTRAMAVTSTTLFGVRYAVDPLLPGLSWLAFPLLFTSSADGGPA